MDFERLKKQEKGCSYRNASVRGSIVKIIRGIVQYSSELEGNLGICGLQLGIITRDVHNLLNFNGNTENCL